MDDEHRAILFRYWKYFRNNLEPLKILPNLSNFLTEEDFALVYSKRTLYEQVDTMVLDIIPRRGPSAFEVFVRAIEATPGQSYIAESLLRDSGIAPLDMNNVRTQLYGERQNSACLRGKLCQLKQENEDLKAKLMQIHREHSETMNTLRNCRAKMKMKDVLNVWCNYKRMKNIDFLENSCREFEECVRDLTNELREIKQRNKQLDEQLAKLREENSATVIQMIESQKKPRELVLCSLSSIDIESEVFGQAGASTERPEKIPEHEDETTGGVGSLTSRSEKLPTRQEEQLRTVMTPPAIRPYSRHSERERFGPSHEVTMLQDRLESQKKTHNAELHGKEAQIRHLEEQVNQEKLKRVNGVKRVRELEKRVKTLNAELKRTRATDSAAGDHGHPGQSDGLLVQRVKEVEKSLEHERKKRNEVDEERRRFCNEAIEKKRQVELLSSQVERLNKQVQRLETFPGRIFSYHSDFDTNGVLYGLATSFGRSAWVDPARSGKVCVLQSSNNEGQTSQIVYHTVNARRNPSCCTRNEKGSWWQVGFTSNLALVLSHYTLRHGCCDGVCVLKNWEFQGSNDGEKWTILDTNKDSTSLPLQSFSTCTFRVKGNISAMKYFRVLQTGKNSSGNYRLYLSGLELYGLLVQLEKV